MARGRKRKPQESAESLEVKQPTEYQKHMSSWDSSAEKKKAAKESSLKESALISHKKFAKFSNEEKKQP